MIPRAVRDRAVEHQRRYKLEIVNGTTDTYDLTPIPGVVTESGTVINKGYLQPLEDAVGSIFNGDRVSYTWVNGLPTEELHRDLSNRIVKQVNYIWLNGLPQTVTTTLNSYNDAGALIEAKTKTETYTWVNGLPTEVIRS